MKSENLRSLQAKLLSLEGSIPREKKKKRRQEYGDCTGPYDLAKEKKKYNSIKARQKSPIFRKT